MSSLNGVGIANHASYNTRDFQNLKQKIIKRNSEELSLHRHSDGRYPAASFQLPCHISVETKSSCLCREARRYGVTTYKGNVTTMFVKEIVIAPLAEFLYEVLQVLSFKSPYIGSSSAMQISMIE